MVRQRGTVGAGVLLGLLFLTVACRADEAGTVKAIEKLGGKVTRDTKRPGKPVVGVDLSGPKITDAGVKVLKELKSLQELVLSDTTVTDAGLKELKELQGLRELNLAGTKVTDTGLRELKGLKNLQMLYLYGNAVMDAGLKELKELKNLKILGPTGTKVTDAGIQELQAERPGLQIDR